MAAALGAAAAWSPNPTNPPLYLDTAIKNDEPQPEIRAKWPANAALNMKDQYVGNLRQYRAIGVEVGDKDTGVATKTKLHEVLDGYKIDNSLSSSRARIQQSGLPVPGTHAAVLQQEPVLHEELPLAAYAGASLGDQSQGNAPADGTNFFTRHAIHTTDEEKPCQRQILKTASCSTVARPCSCRQPLEWDLP